MASGNDETDCSFCAIVRGEDNTTEVICQGETWVAFFPLNPATPGHTLVVRRAHVSDLWQVEPPLAAELMEAVLRVGHAVDASLKPEGMNLITSAVRPPSRRCSTSTCTSCHGGSETASAKSGRPTQSSSTRGFWTTWRTEFVRSAAASDTHIKLESFLTSSNMNSLPVSIRRFLMYSS